MRKLLLAAFVLATPAHAGAEEKYDRALEQSVMRIVAAKMGELRSGFDYRERPAMVGVLRQAQPPAPADDWVDGLAPARKRVIAPVGRM